MKRLAYSFAAVGLASLLLAILTSGLVGSIATLISLAFMGAAGVAFFVYAVRRLARGEVKLRPWDAMREIPLLFAAILAIKFLASHFFSDGDDNLIAMFFSSLILATLYALHSTAYRRIA